VDLLLRSPDVTLATLTDIHQGQIDTMLCGQVNRFACSARNADYGVPGIRNLLLQVKGNQGVIFDNQDLHRQFLDVVSVPSGLAAADRMMR
jgi:hypothetical protein